MSMLRKYGWCLSLVIGLVAGLVISNLWPQTPLHAVATDRGNNFAMATGPVDGDVEAVFYLDFLTGSLKAAVPSKKTRGMFQATYETNVNADLMQVVGALNGKVQRINAARQRRGDEPLPQIQLPTTPNYMIVTGVSDIVPSPGQRLRPGTSLVYVAETNTGILLAYVIPWSPEMHSADNPFHGTLQLWAGDQVSTALIQTQ